MMIYFIGVAVSAVLTIALGALFYFSDEEITIGNIFCGILIAFTSWVGVVGYAALVVAVGVDFIVHREFWSKILFKRNKE